MRHIYAHNMRLMRGLLGFQIFQRDNVAWVFLCTISHRRGCFLFRTVQALNAMPIVLHRYRFYSVPSCLGVCLGEKTRTQTGKKNRETCCCVIAVTLIRSARTTGAMQASVGLRASDDCSVRMGMRRMDVVGTLMCSATFMRRSEYDIFFAASARNACGKSGDREW